jgi:uncharacterized membrane protein YcaP (DUF421 family)
VSEWFGASWATVGYVVAGTVVMYASAVVGVRLAGRRTLAQMSAYDAVITVALGTLVSSVAVTSDPSYAQGLTALVTLLALQASLGLLRSRSGWVRRAMDFRPEAVVRDGRIELPEGLATSQLTQSELWSRLRQHGVADVGEVALVLLEPQGSITIARDAATAEAMLDRLKAT